jgi:DNA repair exonuclease SbcCD ATPase subunit
MAFKIKSLTVKNFMSVGNATQAVNFDRNDLTLVLGENNDLGGDDGGSRNGTGKTTIINALSFGLFGSALSNIKKDNLINKTNAKNMLVTIDFEKDGVEYKIERGRKPSVMRFWVAGEKKEATDEAQGDSRETQQEIERMLCMSHDMFKHIIALNTYTTPFLDMKAGEQRVIIEQLLGITLLSEKADALKEQSTETKKAITQEQYRIDAVLNANKRIEEQIDSLKRRQTLWLNKQKDDISKLSESYDELIHIDIDKELAAHKALATWNQLNSDINGLNAAIKRVELAKDKEEKLVNKLSKEVESLAAHKCHTCGQDFHDDAHAEVVQRKRTELDTSVNDYAEYLDQLTDLNAALEEVGALGPVPKVYYDTEAEAVNHKAKLANILQQLATKEEDKDPYAEQIEEMKTKGIEEVKYDHINQLNSVKDHQEFLFKMLTNKDSFIRKLIIDQNLTHLNARLAFYLDKIGLPHTVKFNNDLTVAIEELGRELDFDNLSRGERTRLILSLSWSFRDVWESLYQTVNLLFIDELVDNGMDTAGVENTLAILKKMSREGDKSIWLVSHKDELIGRVNQVFNVIKENGYTTYGTDTEVV